MPRFQVINFLVREQPLGHIPYPGFQPNLV